MVEPAICCYLVVLLKKHEASTGFIVYLGFFGGAKTLYESVLKPLLKQHEAEIDAKLAKAQGMANETLKKAQDATKTQ